MLLQRFFPPLDERMAQIRCPHTQPIRNPATGRTTLKRCGKCHYCRSVPARRYAGQIVSEINYRPDGSIRPIDEVAMFILTFDEEHLPWTEPKIHILGRDHDAPGLPYGGPYVGGYTRIGKRPKDNQPCHVRRGVDGERYLDDVLTDKELEMEHEAYLVDVLGWTDEDVGRWLDGNYDSVPTVSRKLIQDYTRSIRDAVRNKGYVPRHFAGLEYGDGNGRPHTHMTLFDLPAKYRHLIYDRWIYGHVHPDMEHAVDVYQGALTPGPGAAVYMAKDASKQLRTMAGSPELLARESAKPLYSKKPPIGDGAYWHWVRDWILPAVQKAEKRYSQFSEEDLEFARCFAIKNNYSAHHIGIAGDKKPYPAPRSWGQRVINDLEINPDLWNKVSDYVEIYEEVFHATTSIPEAHGGLQESWQEHNREIARVMQERKSEYDERRAIKARNYQQRFGKLAEP